MASAWHKKKEKLAQMQLEKELAESGNNFSDELVSKDIREAAMGKGHDELFEKKLSKDEKKARAKAQRDAKKKAKMQAQGGMDADNDDDDDDDNNNGEDDDNDGEKGEQVQEKVALEAQMSKNAGEDGIDYEQADKLAADGTICTFATSRKGVDARSRDINVQNFTLQHKGAVMLDETEILLNHGNRYGLIGRNGCGKVCTSIFCWRAVPCRACHNVLRPSSLVLKYKLYLISNTNHCATPFAIQNKITQSTLMKALGARAVPIPRSIDIFFLKEEIEASDSVTALEAVMSVDAERLRLEEQAEELNHMVSDLAEKEDGYEDEDGKTADELQEEIMETLNSVYERLDALDAATAEVRARTILKGLGFTHAMQSKKTKEFSGGWRMRVSLARALFIQPVCLLLDEPTNHLDMEAVIWLEDYLSKWDRILLLVSHSQDFLNNVCTHMVHFTNKKKLIYYDGNYDQFVKTKGEKEENQMKQYKWEQDQIKSMKEYIARFGHGTSKNAKQAQSKEKVLAKMVRGGLTEKPEEEKMLNFKFPDPGHLPPPVLAFRDVSFGYPGCEPLYTNVNFGVDLDSRIALVGPNGAGMCFS